MEEKKPVQNPIPQPTASATIPNSEQKPRFSKKIIAIIVILILLLIGGSFLLFKNNAGKTIPTPSPTLIPADETANWKTYENTTYGFSFRYDNSFTLIERKTQNGLINNTDEVYLRNFTDETQLTDHKATGILVSNLKVTGDIDDVEVWLEKEKIAYSDISGTPRTTIRNLLKTKIANMEAIVYESGSEDTHKNVIFYKDKKLVQFTLIATGETGSSYKDLPQASSTFDQILSTFKFTDQGSQIDTSRWKTFNDAKQGISFKYPYSWTAKPLQDSTLTVFLDSEPFNICNGCEMSTSIDVGLNEVTNTITNEKYFRHTTLSEGQKNIEELLDAKTVKIKNLQVGGKNAVQISGEGLEWIEGYHQWTLVQLDKKLLEIALHNKDFENIYQEILKSFKFTQ